MFIIEELRRNDEAPSWNPVFQKLNLETHKRTEALTLKAAKLPENKGLNRYRDVLPYDHSRVILDAEGSRPRYINANYVELPGVGHKYILTQGPLPNTCGHFWQMVWEQNSNTIIMLNKILEKNAIKCHPYWPMGESEVAEFDSFRITNESEKMKSCYIIRHFTVLNTKTNQSRKVKHFHYVMWPDFGVPEDPENFLSFLSDIRESGAFEKSSGPPVVHCSAGIGRSGTFCLVDSALTKVLKDHSADDIPIRDMLLELRMQRVGLIQTAEQLRFSYLAIVYGIHSVLPEVFADLEEDPSSNGGTEEPPPLPPRPGKREDETISTPHGTKRTNEDAVAEEDERQKRMLKSLHNLDDSSDGSEEDEIIDLDASDNEFDDITNGDDDSPDDVSLSHAGSNPPRKPLPPLPPDSAIGDVDFLENGAEGTSSSPISIEPSKVSGGDRPDDASPSHSPEATDPLVEPTDQSACGSKASDPQGLTHRQRREERKQHTANIVNNIKRNVQAHEQHSSSQSMWIKSAIAVGVCVGIFAVYKLVT